MLSANPMTVAGSRTPNRFGLGSVTRSQKAAAQFTDVEPWGRPILGPIGSGGAGVRHAAELWRYAWGSYQVSPADSSVHIEITTADA